MKNGCECRKCHSFKNIVIDSRWQDNTRVRTRLCQRCGSRWKTVEIDYWDYVHNKVKKDAEFS